MKKILAILSLLIIVVIAAIPFGVGITLEDQYNKTIAQLNNFYAGHLKFVGKFDRGYFKSNAVTEIESADFSRTMTFKHKLFHGPVVFNNGFQGFELTQIITSIDETIEKQLTNLYKDKPSYSCTTDIAFNGDGHTKFVNNPLQTSIFGGELNWKGMIFELKTTKYFANFEGTVSIPSLQFSEIGADAAVTKNISIDGVKFDFVSGSAAVFATSNFSLEDVKISIGQQIIAAIEKLKVSGKSQEINSLLSVETSYAFSKLLVGSDQYGPLALDIKFKNIDTKVLQDSATKIKASAQVNIEQEQILQILNAHPSMLMDLSMTMPSGKMTTNVDLQLTSNTQITLDQSSILSAIKAKSTMSIDHNLAFQILTIFAENKLERQAKQFALANPDPSVKNPFVLPLPQVQSIIEQWVITFTDKLKEYKILQEDETSFSYAATLENNVLTVNDREVTHEEFKNVINMLQIVVPTTKPAVAAPVDPAAAAAPVTTTTPATPEPEVTPESN